MATVNTAPEEEKVEELSEKQLKILGILEARSREYMDAIEYVQNTTKDNQAIINLLTTAEKLKALKKKVTDGGALTKEDTAAVKPVSAEVIFGYTEAQRIAKLNEVYAEVQKQVQEITQKALKFKEALKKMIRKQDKE